MTENTIGNAVAKQDDVGRVVNYIEGAASDYGRVLPTHLDASHWVRLACGLLQRNATLAEAAVSNPNSFKAALLECARLGHDPGTEAFAFVPFKENGRLTVVGIEQYQGEIERMYRAGAVDAVICEVVRQNDYFNWQPGERPQHDAEWFATAEARGPLVGVYAYAVLKGGGISKVVVMGAEEVAKHRAAAKTKNIWDTWQESMWRKTAIHELEKWVPTSAEYQRERLRTLAEAQHVTVTQLPAPEPRALEEAKEE